MKTLTLTALLALLALPARAQLLSNDAVGSAVVGGVIGGIIGHNSGRHTAEGIGIGAGAGLLLGAIAERNRRDYYADRRYVVVQPAPTYRARRPASAVTGAVLGGIAGGVIGHNNNRHTAEGVAIGAASGALLGALAQADARQRTEVHYVQTTPTYVVQQPVENASATVSTSPQPTATTRVIEKPNRSVPSSMASANALFGR